MLGVGLVVGAAIGPSPSQTFGLGAPLAALLKSLLAEHARVPAGKGNSGGSTGAGGGAGGSTFTPGPASETAQEEAPAEEEENGGGGGGGGEKKAKYPPINRVWIIHLSGAGFGEALESTAGGHYIDQTAIPQGSLMAKWSAISGQNFATDVAQLATSESQFVQNVVQSPCPTGQQCLPGTPGGLAAADAFLEKTLPVIEATGPYKTNGLIVVVFGTVAEGPESEYPTGSVTSLLASQPPGGALLISPFVAAGKRPTTNFDPASPERSMEALLVVRPKQQTH